MYTRLNTFYSRITERSLLTGSTSTKKTFHLVLDITDAQLPFKVGDSIGMHPTNDPREVDQILHILQISPDEQVLDLRTQGSLSIRKFLLHRANLARVGLPFLKLLIAQGAPLRHLLDPDRATSLAEFFHTHTLISLLPYAPLTATHLAQTTMPLLPRFYSIANSSKMFPNEIHLLIAYVQYHAHGQNRHGVGSYFLCDLATPNITPIPIYIQPSHQFTLPQDPNASIILIGPGTGIAPYRAFLQERLATQSTGRNWVFFGERNRATDFYYADFWLDLEKQGRLRLDLAFSRDGPNKVYVQHKMYEQRKSLWSWLQEGAYFYVCGDASKMAKEVGAMLHAIVKEEGHLSETDARSYIQTMRREKRYLTDVY